MPPSLSSLQKKAQPKEVFFILILNFVSSGLFQATADFRWYVWIFAPVTRTDPTNNILQELDLPHKYPQISPEDFVETSRPLNCGSVNSDKVGLYGWLPVTSKERMVGQTVETTLSCENCWKYNWPMKFVYIHIQVLDGSGASSGESRRHLSLVLLCTKCLLGSRLE